MVQKWEFIILTNQLENEKAMKKEAEKKSTTRAKACKKDLSQIKRA